jgi:hypothetical protein
VIFGIPVTFSAGRMSRGMLNDETMILLNEALLIALDLPGQV